LLACLAGLGHLFSRGDVQLGRDLDMPYLLRADAEVQGQQVTNHVFGLVQAPGLGAGRMGQALAGDFGRPPALARCAAALKFLVVMGAPP